MTPRFVLLANPDNRRATLFQEALAAQGLPPAEVISWRTFLRDPSVVERIPDEPRWLRVDSFGEDFEVERELLLRGARAAARERPRPVTLTPAQVSSLRADRGRIFAPRQLHLGLEGALLDLAHVLARRPSWRVLNVPSEIRELFDKRLTSARFEAAGIPVPPRHDAAGGARELRDRLLAEAVPEVFVKLASGSSASCLGIWTLAPRPSFLTTIEIARTGWYNSLRLRRYEDPPRITQLVDYLLREGAQVESCIPKARTGSDFFDLRVLVVAGEPAFTVARASPHPITNLHLGGRRADLGGLRLGAGATADIDKTCRRIGGLYSSLHVGVDVLVEADRLSHRVVEANAFGDLLPGLTRDGCSVHEWEIRAALRGAHR